MGFILRNTITDGGNIINYYRDDTNDAGPGTEARHYAKVNGLDSPIFPGTEPIITPNTTTRYLVFPPTPEVTRFKLSSDALTAGVPLVLAWNRIA